ncbi:MAG: hypothetical protein V4857_22925 [Pseudomonadota bacterium]
MMRIVARAALAAALCTAQAADASTPCYSEALHWTRTFAGGKILVSTSFGHVLSDDNGKTWSPAAPVIKDVQARPARIGADLYLSEAAGMFRSSDFGRSWRRIGPQRNGAAGDGSGLVYACSADGRAVEKFDARAGTWSATGTLEASARANVTTRDVDGTSSTTECGDLNGKQQFALCEQVALGGGAVNVISKHAVFQSTDGGKQWSGAGLPRAGNEDWRNVAGPVLVDSDGVLYRNRAPLQDDYRVHLSRDRGQSWQVADLLPANPADAPLTLIVGVEGRALYVVSARVKANPHATGLRPLALYRVTEGKAEKLTDLALGWVGDLGFFSIGPDGTLSLTAYDHILLRPADSEQWLKIEGRAMTQKSWINCISTPRSTSDGAVPGRDKLVAQLEPAGAQP